MRRSNIYIRIFFLVSVFFLMLNLILFFSTGCKQKDADISEKTSEKMGETAKGLEEEKEEAFFLEGFPSSVPIYPGSVIVESDKSEMEGLLYYKLILRCDGDIKKLSDWYKQSLEKEWILGSISEGDMGTWSEFFAEAQNEGYFLTVYLYQDEGSNNVSIDINVQSLAEVGEVAEYIEQDTIQPSESYSGELENAKIAFVCASVGSAWNIDEHFPQLNISVYDEYQFDKGYRIQEILDYERPDIMIIKECAAYFPPDSYGSLMSAYQNLIRDWVNLCRAQGVSPVLTTVVPIDPANPSNSGQSQLNSILDFNDWIKQYCSNENISVIDLEKALHTSDTNRSLNPAYDSGDGLHLNERAYSEKLDNILIPALERALETGY